MNSLLASSIPPFRSVPLRGIGCSSRMADRSVLGFLAVKSVSILTDCSRLRLLAPVSPPRLEMMADNESLIPCPSSLNRCPSLIHSAIPQTILSVLRLSAVSSVSSAACPGPGPVILYRFLYSGKHLDHMPGGHCRRYGTRTVSWTSCDNIN